MTSEDASARALIDLIYRHLKENGYEKVASALKKHAPQVETTKVNVSLDAIFKKWVSEEKERNEGKYLQTSSVHNTSPEKKVKSQTPSAARNQKRKRNETKTRKRPSAVEGQRAGEDSDSDSSLDVEKWKSLALQLSDADIAKMDAFTNLNTSTLKSTRKRKPAQPKKKQDQTISSIKASPKKTKAKTTTSPKSTDKSRSSLKPKAVSVHDTDQTPSDKDIFAEPNVKSPASKMGTSFSDQVATPKTGVSNGLSESDRSEVKHKKKHSHSESHNIETPSKEAETEKTNNISDPKTTDTPSKKKKSKKDVKGTTPGSLETPSRVANPEVAIQSSQCGLDSAEFNSSKTSAAKAKKDKSKKVKIVVGVDTTIQTVTEDASFSVTSDQSKINQVLDFNSVETPKKAKSKKSKKSKEPKELGDVALPSGECQIEVDSSQSTLGHNETLSTSVTKAETVGDEMVEKQSKKAKKNLLEPKGTETPSKKIEIQAATSILEPPSSETPSKKFKSKKTSEANQVNSPSKKAVVDVVEDEAMKSCSLKSDHTDILLKKGKRKRGDSTGENGTSSLNQQVSKASSECDNPGADNSQESVSAVEEEGNPDRKKRKKNKKDKEKKKNENDENTEEVPPTPPAEEFADSLPGIHKKKKNKKLKHREEEMPSLCTPAPEEDTPKKKKKSSKEKEHADVSEQGLI